MGRFDTTKQTIDANIKTNGNQAITGQVLNSVMKDMLSATDAELTELSADYKKNFATIAANRVKFVDGIYVAEYGQVPNIAFDSIDYLEIAEYDEFNFTNLINPEDGALSVCFYDKDKTIVSSVRQSTLNVGGISKIIAPQGAKYVRCSIRVSEKSNFYCFISKGDSPKNEDIKLDIFSHDSQSNYVSGFVADTYINGEGKEIKYTGFYSTKEVYILPNTPYYHAGFYGGYYAFYDKDGKVLESYGINAGPIPNPFYAPENTHYARFTCTSEKDKDSAWVFTENRKPVPYKEVVSEEYLPSNLEEKTHCNFEGEEIGVFHRGICIGDSLTEGAMNYVNSNGGQGYISIREKSYPQYLKKLTGIEIDNFGHGGATSFEWYAMEKDTDLSGYDFAIIQLGVNDANRNGTNYGTVWSDDSQQGFLSIVNKLRNENKGIKIFVSTIIPAMSYASQSMIDMCQYIRDFVANLNDKNVILLDMQVYGNTKDAEAYNCGHLSALGYWRLAKDYQGIISYYISKHMDEFSEVQFIGTDYQYVL